MNVYAVLITVGILILFAFAMDIIANMKEGGPK